MKAGYLLRIKLDLSQQQMANLLGIIKSHYSLYELNLRDLPDKAQRKLSEMEMHFKNPDAFRRPDTIQHLGKGKIQQKIQAFTRLHDKALKRAQHGSNKLDEMQDKYNTQQNLLGFIEAMRNGEDERQKHMLNIMEANAIKKLNTCNELQQQTLQQRIDVANFECVVCNRIIKALQKIS